MYPPPSSPHNASKSALRVDLPRTPLFIAWSLFLSASVFAQTPAGDASPAPDAVAQAPLPAADTTKPGAAPKDDELFELEPFVVNTSKDTSYGALNSNAIARFNTELSKVPISADIFTEEFMRDMGTTTVEELLGDYGAGTGMVLATPDSDANANQPGDRFSVSQIGVRGLSGGNIRRDGFEISSTNVNDTDSAFVERVEVLRGPQGLLYGAGGAGGSITAMSKRAQYGRNKGSFSVRIDKYGSRRGTLDLNVGTAKMAARVVILDSDTEFLRKFIGNKTQGYYGQFAFKLPLRTTLRLQAERTTNDRINASSQNNLNLGSATIDPRHNASLAYLIATGQTGAINPATGLPFPRGAILDGNLDWENYSSFMGWRAEEDIKNSVLLASADTVWADWLSSTVSIMHNKSTGMRSSNATGLSAPRLLNSPPLAPIGNNNPFDNDWAVASTMMDSVSASHRTALRAAVLITKGLFSDRAKTQTAFGYDRDRSGSGSTDYGYFLSDSSGNVIVNPSSTTNLGRTAMPTQWWSVTNGPQKHPFAYQGAPIIVGQDGNYYTRQVRNPRSNAYIADNNPIGLASVFFRGGGISGNSKAGYTDTRDVSGLFVANITSWYSDRVQTLAGFRRTTTETKSPNTTFTIQKAYAETDNTNDSWNLGVNVRALSWLRPYYGVSSTFNNSSGANDPLGNPPKTTEGFGQEIGLKFSPADGRVSGSVAYYWTDDKNQNYNYGTALRDSVNPSGLNGNYDGISGRNQWVSLDKTSRGLEVIMTAALTKNWRTRLAMTQADGRVGTDKVYPILYNDQFYTNSSGGVTYANGTPVMVPTDAAGVTRVLALRSATNPATVLAASGSNVTQLTTAMIGDPNSDYYAFRKGNAETINGAIRNNNDTPVADVLRYFSLPNVGTPLTGAVGLPISSIQYAWSDPANTGGQIIAAQSGENTVGYAGFRVSLTNTYDFSSGFMKGASVGLTYNQSWDNRTYYYNNPDRSRVLFKAPLLGPQFNLMLAYRRKVFGVDWRTQLNVSNVFNHYLIGLQPNNGTGFTNPANIGAGFYGQPRFYAWTNTFSF